LGYAPYAAGLYTNNRFGTEWFVLFGAALCGISAGVFWMAEAAIAIAYPEPWNKGKALGYWLTYRLSGQILGGAINLGLNADRDQAGKVSYTVFLVFIALQSAGPFVGFLLNKPEKVQRKDGKKVELKILENPWFEIKETTRLFFTKRFLLTVLWIGQAVFAEAVFFTYLSCTYSFLYLLFHSAFQYLSPLGERSFADYASVWFSVRARALGSFVSGLAAVICGNLLGQYLDRASIALRKRARTSFFFILVIQGAWWLWATILVTKFRTTRPTYDWSSNGFGHSFAVFVLLTAGFQMNYLLLYFIITNLARNEPEVIRYAALLRGTESAWQALSYDLSSLTIFAEVGGVYFNFALWAVAIWPAWVVVRGFGNVLPIEESRKPIESAEGDGIIIGKNEGGGKEVQV
jgi:hypothetical protein